MDRDRLSPVLARFAPSARVFHSGPLCGVADFDEHQGVGHLHVLRAGRLVVSRGDAEPLVIDGPAVVFYPRPHGHRLHGGPGRGADLVCSSVLLGGGADNPLGRALPDVIAVSLDDVEGLAPALSLLFEEASRQACGRTAALNSLSEYVLVLLVRHVAASGGLRAGVLAGLTDPRLAPALAAMHEAPEEPWSLEALSHCAGMSRARFAHHFRLTVGVTPLDYLTEWRVGAAQQLLRSGAPLKVVAPAVGYESPAAFSRAFARRTGMSPRAWLEHDRAPSTAVTRPAASRASSGDNDSDTASRAPSRQAG